MVHHLHYRDCQNFINTGHCLIYSGNSTLLDIDYNKGFRNWVLECKTSVEECKDSSSG